LLGTTPYPTQIAPVCLAAHPDDVPKCSTAPDDAGLQFAAADKAAALASHARYVDTTPWFCDAVCPPIVAGQVVYDESGEHITFTWAEYLADVLGQALGFRLPHSSART
jgi:SGNH domain (fused to AT3 domains)